MIRAVFFDFYSTLVTFDPPREELQVRACREFGVEVDPLAIPRGYWVADDFMSRENARHAIQKRSSEEAQRFWASYESRLLQAAGVDVSEELALRIVTRLREMDRSLVLFDDVLPTLRMLKARRLVVGLVSNLSRSLDTYCEELGLAHYVDFALTSSQVNSEKPHPQIFIAALAQAKVRAPEALHVGDQYYADVVGARGASITPLLLDRDGFWAEIDGCSRIRYLTEIVQYL
jgi:putative hydrolase of the HAD superfamily